MKNRSLIKGNDNNVIQDSTKSKISIGDKPTKKKRSKFWVVLGVIITLIALIVQVVVGWGDIIKLIYAK